MSSASPPPQGVRSRPRRASMLREAVLTGCISTPRPMSGRTTGTTKETSDSHPTTSSSAAVRPAFWRLSRETGKSSGDSVPTSVNPQNSSAIRQIIGQHHAHIIPKGLPGAGNLLVFDNGGSSGYGFTNPTAHQRRQFLARAGSRVLEVNPVTLELVWSYAGPRFFGSNISGAQRLPNGNTLVTEGPGGRLFEVTREGQIVWEYIYPRFQRRTVCKQRLPRLSTPLRLDSANRAA